MGSSTKSDFLKMRPIPKKLYMYGIQWTGCSSGNSLKSKFILWLNVFRIIQTLSSGDPVTVEVFILVDRPLTDLGVAGGAAGELLLLHAHLCCAQGEACLRWGQSTGGECADPENPDPAALPDSPTPDTGTPRSCYWAQVILLSLEPGWICQKLRKPTEFFWYPKACPDSP